MGALAVHLSRGAPVRPDTVARMLTVAPHRGPQQVLDATGQVALGVTNDPDWVTATLARDGDRLAAFCGTLDNEAELRAEIGGESAQALSSRTPAATLLAGHARWGNEVFQRLRGSFSGAITDGTAVSCFRDQFGARPMFHHDGPAGFFAGTEVKQVLAGAPISREPNRDHLHCVLFGGVDRSTAYRGVERIPKSSVVSAGARVGIEFREYWDPSRYVETTKVGPDEAMEGLVDALDRAVRRHLTGRDVILLSGGLDSPALAVFAARAAELARPVQALTSIYPDYPSVDESSWTEMAANHVGMPLHRFVATAGSLDDVEHWVGLLDGPVDIVSIPEAAEAYREARALGARTVINGEAAEFLFECRSFLLDHLLAHGRVKAATRVMSRLREHGRRYVARQLAMAVVPRRLLSAYRRRKPRRHRSVPPWIDHQRLLAARSRPTRFVGPRRRWMVAQTAPLRGPGIGFEADEICAAYCGVDSRRPFADVDLWQFVLSLPAEVKFPTQRTKPLLREAMRGLLPDALIDRTDKTTFNEFHVAKADYPTLKRLLIDPPDRLDGVDYALLRGRLEAGDMIARELQWARDVARIHVFLGQWR